MEDAGFRVSTRRQRIERRIAGELRAPITGTGYRSIRISLLSRNSARSGNPFVSLSPTSRESGSAAAGVGAGRWGGGERGLQLR